MRGFTGEVSKRPHVSMGGRTNKQETREQVLERTRLEREKRKQNKLEQQSATTIQAYWRRRRVVRQLQSALRQAWDERYTALANANIGGAVWHTSLLPLFLAFSTTAARRIPADPATVQSDIQRLAALCRGLLTAARQPGGLARLAPATSPYAATGPEGYDRLVFLLARLAEHCLVALDLLTQADVQARQQLAVQRPAAAQLADCGALSAAHALGETLLMLVSADSWGGAGGDQAAAAAPAAAAVTTRLALGYILTPRDHAATTIPPSAASSNPSSSTRQRGGSQLSRRLGRLLVRCRGYSASSNSIGGGGVGSGAAAAAGGVARPYVELLTTQLVVRALSLKAPDTGALLLERLPADEGLQLLLCVPDLSTSVPSLAPVFKHLVRLAAVSVASLTPAALLSCQHGARYLLTEGDGQACGAPASAAALLGNIVMGAPKALSGTTQPANYHTAFAICTAVNRLLVILPTQLLRPATAARHPPATSPTKRAAAPAIPDDTDTQTTAENRLNDALSAYEVEETAVTPVSMASKGQLGGVSAVSVGVPHTRQGMQQGGTQQSARLVMPHDELFPAELVESVKSIDGPHGLTLLGTLIRLLLPLSTHTDTTHTSTPTTHTTTTNGFGPSTSTSMGGASVSQGTANSTLEYCAGAYQLCRLIQQVASITPSRFQLDVTLGVTFGLVGRLWFSALRPWRAAQLAGTAGAAAWRAAPSASHTATPSHTHTGLSTSFGGAAPTSTHMAASTLQVSNSSSVVTSGGSSGHTQGPVPDLEVLGLLCRVFQAQLSVADVSEFYQGVPLPLSEIYDASRPQHGFLSTLKAAMWNLLWVSNDTQSTHTTAATTHTTASTSASTATATPAQAAAAAARQVQQLQRQTFLAAAGELYMALYDQNGLKTGTGTGSGGAGGRVFCPASAFYASSLGPDRFAAEAAAARASQDQPASGHLSSRTDLGHRIWQVLKYAPPLVPFEERARLFQSEVSAARQEYLENSMRSQMMLAEISGMFQPNQFVKIRRQQMLLDGYDSLSNQSTDMLKGKVRVTFVDDEGAQEAGVDGGGLFKDFLEGLVKEGFGAERGLFLANAQNELHPNPAAYTHVPEAPQLLHFLGRMLGKAMWEGILLEVPLAQFFLKKLRGGHCDLRDLSSLDEQLYNNLMSLRKYSQAELSDLSLTFTVTREVYGSHTEVELTPGGSHVHVTSANLGEYIARVANYRLNVEPAKACAAFVAGFNEMVPPTWVALFNESELQMLISGRSGPGGLDLADLSAHTDYSGGYHAEHPVILNLWKALASFTPEQQHSYLKFVTACSRAPLLGFNCTSVCAEEAATKKIYTTKAAEHLKKQQEMAGSVLDPSCMERLPTASTCVNLLKLPPYQSLETMRQKLLLAITGATTFELS